MRRSVGILVALALALLTASPAGAKCCALTTPPAPAQLRAGEEWIAQIELNGDRAHWPDEAPTLIAWSDSTRELFSVQAKRSPQPSVYHARVVFPEPGRWSYAVTFGGFAGSASAPVREITIEPEPSPLLERAVAALLLLGGAGVALRRRRL
jgi:hypothetical protein